ncbi:phage tail sheath subtilisin-like domain-containing protein [Halomicronema sp. CCY15110]|uniref:phage tail sheath family protein n=1 Tax=Halomicronema sp. CCY15110 TaxID=2767773 RepID=UPI001EF28C2C|nr:phage tail sheath subtilisin-like domain-containing protein [Halomicronema sp. CCY15110]
MAVTPTYPGVYIQEIPSGVRTIVGVGTSTAVFLGRTPQGPLNEPVLCLGYPDFERAFTGDRAGSELPRAVQLFFLNGGTRCYVMRLANDATYAAVTLRNEANSEDVLVATAKSAGLSGSTIRLAVSYGTTQPESTFNLEVFRWVTNSRGAQVKADVEQWVGLTMEPGTARYAVNYVTQNSQLLELALPDPDNPPTLGVAGYSQSGLPIPGQTDTIFRDRCLTLMGSNSAFGNRFRIFVDGRGPFDVDLSAIDFSVAPLDVDGDIRDNLADAIQQIVNDALTGGLSVTVTFETGPSGPTGDDNQDSVWLRITSSNVDVRIEPAPDNDAAVSLMLGTAQGGLEVSRYGSIRPAANGIVFDINNLVDLAALPQVAFDEITVGTADPIDLGTDLVTSAATDARFYYQADYDATTTAGIVGHSDGVREKLGILAAAINQQKLADNSFKWTAEVWGSRLALIPGDGGDNSQRSLTTGLEAGGGTNIGGNFIDNVRYYSLGSAGTGAFQVSGPPPSDGGAPQLSDYRNAFDILDREVDLYNLMILPKDEDHDAATTASLWGPASVRCQERRAFLLIDPPESWGTVQQATNPTSGVNSLRIGLVKDYSAVFYPRLAMRENGLQIYVNPSGAIAGLIARIDAERGVWKAPAGTEADIRGVVGLEHRFSDREHGVLNPQAINTLRIFPQGIVNFGARTLAGSDEQASEYKYIPVRRLALFIEESLYRGLQWVVFEPNDEPLWAQIRLNVGAFMNNLFRQGAFQGRSPNEAYFVKCDRETTTQNDINLGIVNILVGFAPLKPAEFVILSLQQIAGEIQT